MSETDGYNRPAMLDPARRLELLRQSRVFRDRATPVGPMMQAIGSDLKRTEKRIGGIGAAWAAACPHALATKTAIEGLSRGVLTVTADDASTRYEIDRWLRAGGERELVRQCPTTVRKIRITLADSRD